MRKNWRVKAYQSLIPVIALIAIAAAASTAGRSPQTASVPINGKVVKSDAEWRAVLSPGAVPRDPAEGN